MKKPRLNPLVFENLVEAAMFYHWVDAHEQDEAKDGDLSFRNAINSARDELNRHGSALPTLEEFAERMKETLTLEPTEFVRRLDARRAQDARREAAYADGD